MSRGDTRTARAAVDRQTHGNRQNEPFTFATPPRLGLGPPKCLLPAFHPPNSFPVQPLRSLNPQQTVRVELGPSCCNGWPDRQTGRGPTPSRPTDSLDKTRQGQTRQGKARLVDLRLLHDCPLVGRDDNYTIIPIARAEIAPAAAAQPRANPQQRNPNSKTLNPKPAHLQRQPGRQNRRRVVAPHRRVVQPRGRHQVVANAQHLLHLGRRLHAADEHAPERTAWWRAAQRAPRSNALAVRATPPLGRPECPSFEAPEMRVLCMAAK
jgi:hypothetical protein